MSVQTLPRRVSCPASGVRVDVVRVARNRVVRRAVTPLPGAGVVIACDFRSPAPWSPCDAA